MPPEIAPQQVLLFGSNVWIPEIQKAACRAYFVAVNTANADGSLNAERQDCMRQISEALATLFKQHTALESIGALASGRGAMPIFWMEGAVNLPEDFADAVESPPAQHASVRQEWEQRLVETMQGLEESGVLPADAWLCGETTNWTPHTDFELLRTDLQRFLAKIERQEMAADQQDRPNEASIRMPRRGPRML